MGFACTLLGHRYGDVEVEHDREERGGEVIAVTREVATCERCGEERVLSENTEVTSVVDAGDVDVDPGTDAAGGGDDAGDATGTEASNDGGSDAADDPDPTGAEEGTGVVDLPDGDDAGAEVLDDDAGESESGTGTADTVTAPEADTDPDPGAEPVEGEDAEILDDGSEDDGERDYGEWPDSGREDVEETPDPAPDDGDGENESGAEAERSFEEVDPAADVPETLSCPDCGFRTAAAGAALRAGDACPDCGEAYLRADGHERNS